MTAQHKILPLALGVALASSTLVANAADAEKTSPEFYGMLYVSLDNVLGDQWELNSNNSRVGVQQSIPLQNGLTAIWKVEVGVKVDDGNDHKFTQRDIYLGVKGDYGQVRAGRFSTPLRRTEGKIDPFNHLHGDIAAVLGGQTRVSNIAEYTSPKYAHTQLNIAFIPGEGEDLDGDGKNDTDLANTYSFSAVYDNAGLYAALGVDINGEAKTATDIIKDNTVTPNLYGRSDRVQLAAKYQIGAASVGAIVQHAKDSERSEYKENAFIVNSTYKIDDFLLKAQYGLNKGKKTKDELKLAAVGVDYIIDKSSFVTLDYAVRTDDPNNGSKEDIKVVTLGFNQAF